MSKATAIDNGRPKSNRHWLLNPLTSETAREPGRTQLLVSGLIVFLLTLCVRFVCWYYASAEALKVQTTVTNNYKRLARLLLQDGLFAFYDPRSQMSDLDLLGHPPGYPILLAMIYKLLGESDTVVQFVQITADAVAALVIFLIATELLSSRMGIIAGLLAALSPQFSWNAITILPDTISVLPILLAIYVLVHFRKALRWQAVFSAGLLIGISTLLRANSLLLTPFLAGLIVIWRCETPGKRPDSQTRGAHGGTPLQSGRRRVKLAVMLVAGTLMVIAPVTVRNAVVYGYFIPLSLGAGQTLLEGIADYDPAGRFNIPDTDVGIAEMEARQEQRPDYATTLFGPDGIKRERARLARGLTVIRSHPLWFFGVMVQRSVSMLRLERVPIISLDPDHKLNYPGMLRVVQRIFLTAVMLPLALAGVILLAFAKRWSTLAILLAVPVYYFCFQSALHTEYRYVIALNYFLLVFASIAIDVLGSAVWRLVSKRA